MPSETETRIADLQLQLTRERLIRELVSRGANAAHAEFVVFQKVKNEGLILTYAGMRAADNPADLAGIAEKILPDVESLVTGGSGANGKAEAGCATGKEDRCRDRARERDRHAGVSVSHHAHNPDFS